MQHLFNTRVEILQAVTDIVEGARVQAWNKSSDNFDPTCAPGEMMCRLDLIFLRPGKDQPPPIVAGRSPDRTGILFCSNTPALQSGQIARVISGPALGASFLLKMRPDEAQGFSASHHIEVQVFEVAQAGLNYPSGAVL
jgi:hypothetical protein